MTLGFSGPHVPQLRLPEGIRLETISPDRILTPTATPVFERCAIVENEAIAPEHFRIRLHAPKWSSGRAGQFAMVRTAPDADAHPLLPRPMAIYRYFPKDGDIDIVYRNIGEGTLALSERQAGDEVEIVGPLGRPFALRPETRGVLLVGRGIGTCSIVALAETAADLGISVFGLLSGRSSDVVLGAEVFTRFAEDLRTVNDRDGSSSVEQIRPHFDRILASGHIQQIFVCGANRLVDLACTLAAESDVEVQVSLEAHMACGLGYCHACATGAFGEFEESPLVCRDGPVFVASKALENSTAGVSM